MKSFQSRLAPIHDRIRRKLIDNMQSIIGLTTECLAITTRKANREGDPESHEVERAYTANINWPPLTDVPVRQLSKTGDAYSITSLVNAFAEDNAPAYTIQSDRALNVDDLICRTFIQADDKVNVLCCKVSETLASFGANSIIMLKYKVTINVEPLPAELLAVIHDFATRRLTVQY